MGSGLILLLLVGAWLAVLVPMALRSSEVGSATTVDRFSDAMRVLARRDSPVRGAQPGPDEVAEATDQDLSDGAVLDGVVRDEAAPEAPAPDEGALDDAHLLPAPAAVRRPAPTAAARRLRALVVLVLLVVGTLVGAVVGPLWLLAPHLVADLLLVAFLVRLRSQALARAEREWRAAMGERRARPAGSSVRVTRLLPDEPPQARPAPPGRAQDQPFDQHAVDDHRREVVVPAARQAPVPARGAQGEPWQPVPVPTPMYVTAPRAPRRVVDLTGGARVSRPGHDHTLDRPWAVGD